MTTTNCAALPTTYLKKFPGLHVGGEGGLETEVPPWSPGRSPGIGVWEFVPQKLITVGDRKAYCKFAANFLRFFYNKC